MLTSWNIIIVKAWAILMLSVQQVSLLCGAGSVVEDSAHTAHSQLRHFIVNVIKCPGT